MTTKPQSTDEPCPWCRLPAEVHDNNNLGLRYLGCPTKGCVGKDVGFIVDHRWNTRTPASAAPVVDDADNLHLAICQAVHLMNQGDLHAGHDLLRQTLIDYADKKAPLTRSEIIRQQQRSGPKGDPIIMVSPATDQTPYCNPCQSYHPVSQPCFDAATTPRHIAAAATAAPVEQSDVNQPCQRCEKLGGKVVSFSYDSITTSRWVCPHCLDADEGAR